MKQAIMVILFLVVVHFQSGSILEFPNGRCARGVGHTIEIGTGKYCNPMVAVGPYNQNRAVGTIIAVIPTDKVKWVEVR